MVGNQAVIRLLRRTYLADSTMFVAVATVCDLRAAESEIWICLVVLLAMVRSVAVE